MTELSTSDIDRSVEEIMAYPTSFHSFFRVKTRDVIKQSLQYQQGLLLGDNPMQRKTDSQRCHAAATG
jgi:hypothetical protein